MTLLGCVPVEILAETGSNVKSAVESGTEQEKPQKEAWCSPKKRCIGNGIFFSFNDGSISGLIRHSKTDLLMPKGTSKCLLAKY